jgi:dienelactone hydrolase
MLVWLVLCCGVALAQTPRPLPAPTGQYAVGRTIFNWTDETRVDLFSPKGFREIPVWVWYPAAPARDATPAEWMPGLWGELFAAVITPPAMPDKPAGEKYPVNTIRSHSYADAPVVAGQSKYPIILFAPGYGSGPGEYASLIEDLVSRGYIVAGIVPTYFSLFTVFADGRAVGQFQTAREVAGMPRAVANRPDTMEPAFRLWVGDLRFTLNQLEKLNAASQSSLRGRLDLAKVGVIGHSFGATATSQWLKEDARVRAAVTMDGALRGEVARDPKIAKPLFVIQSAMMQNRAVRNPQLNGRKPPEMLSLLRHAKPGYYLMMVGTAHSFASDMGVLPFAQ